MGKRMVILRAGESSAGAAVLAKAKGFDVLVSDKSSIKPKYKEILNNHRAHQEEGQHTEADILSADEIVKNPGIPNKTPITQLLKGQGTPIISETEFIGRYTDSKMIRTMGSNDKTTTTMPAYHILKEADVDVSSTGSVGNSLTLQVVEDSHTVHVIGSNSSQLNNIYDFRADIVIILNMTPDHLNRYNYEMRNYVDAKFRILQNQTKDDASIFWNDDSITAREVARRRPEAALYPFAETHKNGAKGYVESNQVVIETADGIFTMEQDLLALTGTHNLYSSLASGIASEIVDTHDEKIRASLSDFTSVKHRLEEVFHVHGVDYINDSKATNINSCQYALRSMVIPVVLILGGMDKGNDYSKIEELVNKKIHSLIFMSVDNTKLHVFFDGRMANIENVRSMGETVVKAYKTAHKGDTVLLSPCCTSSNLFKSREDRGNQSKACARNS